MREAPTTGDLGAEWDTLVDSSRLPSPFLKSWWLQNATEGAPVVLLCSRPDGSLVGGAAFERDTILFGPLRVDRLRSPGQGVLAPDHLDVVAEPPERNAVTAAVARWLRASGSVIDLDGLAGDSLLPRLLGARIIGREPAPFLDLTPLEADRPMATMPGRLRSTVKRSGKRLAKAGYGIRRIDQSSEPDARARAVDALFALHEERWKESSALSNGAERLGTTLLAGIAAGDVVIHEMADETRVVASEVELLAGSRACFYQAGRLTDHEFRGSGSVLKEAVLAWAMGRGLAEFDLLRGAESYKDDWTGTSREVVRMRMGAGTIASGTALGLNAWMEAAPKVARLRSRLGGVSRAPSRRDP